MNDGAKRFDWRLMLAALLLAAAIPAMAWFYGYQHRGEEGLTLLTLWAQRSCLVICATAALGLAVLQVWSLVEKQWLAALVIAPMLFLSPTIGLTMGVFGPSNYLSEKQIEGADEMTYRVLKSGFMDTSHILVREVNRNPIMVTVEEVADVPALVNECRMLEEGDSVNAPGMIATSDRRVIMLKLGKERCVHAAFDVESQTTWDSSGQSIHELPPDILSKPEAIDTVVPMLPSLPARR